MRTSSVISGLNTSYLWDRLAENPLLIDDGSHAYLYADGPLAQIDTSNNRQYLLTDALNSVRGLSDNSGTLVGSVNYNVFGSIRSQSGASSILGFTGEVYNPQTQLLYLRARDYAATLGRLLSADTVSPNAHEAQGYNLYTYVANNPTTWVDPTGHIISSSDSYRNQTAATGAMMKEVWEYDLNKYGSFMLRTGFLLTAALPLSSGLTAADIGFGVVFLTLYMLEMHILMCLALRGTPCFDSEGLMQLGSDAAGAVAEGVGAMADTLACAGAPVDEATFAGWANADPKLATDLAWKVQAPCVPKPEPKEENVPERCRSDAQAIDALINRADEFHDSLLKSGLKGDKKEWQQSNVAVLRVQVKNGSCVDIVGRSGSRGLRPIQRQLLEIPYEVELQPNFRRPHAEPGVIEFALAGRTAGLIRRLIAMGVSDTICATCTPIVEGSGGEIVTDERKAAKWK
ncbi:MAG: RHS repeat-associated core domain-containing protein [Caldilineaceae bacterium]